MSLSNYLENEVLDHIFGGGARNYTAPTNVYVGLSTTTPQEDGTGVTEPSGGSYARVSTGNSDWSTASGGALSNATLIQFATPTAGWGTVTYVVLYDAASNGNMLGYGALAQSKTINSGDNINFPIGDLDVTLN